MLENFLFSLNAVMPLFLIIAGGFLMRKTRFVSAEFVAGGNKLVFYVALPLTLFRNVYTSDVSDLLDLPFIAFVMISSLLVFFAIWVVSAFFIKDKNILGAFVQGAFRGNFAFLGMPLLFNLAGDAGIARAAIIITFVLPLYNIYSVVVLAANSNSGHRVGPKTILFTIIKNPFIIGILIALIFVLIGIELPQMINRTTVYAANMATPMALLCLGAGINFQGFDKKFKFAVISGAIKVIAVPVVLVTAAYLLGFRDYDLAAILVLGGIPSAIVGYAMVVQMGGDTYIAGTVVVISTLMSAVTLTMFVYVMRVMGLL